MTKMNKTETAKSMFSQGFNCAQSVLSVFAEEAGIELATAKKVTFGFGGGMGRLQNTCGAITGAFMALGLKHGSMEENDEIAKAKIVQLIQQLSDDFIEINNSINCRELLGCNINTTQGMAEARENNYFDTKCTKYIEDVIGLLEDKYFK